jgi:hypothetical protein
MKLQEQTTKIGVFKIFDRNAKIKDCQNPDRRKSKASEFINLLRLQVMEQTIADTELTTLKSGGSASMVGHLPKNKTNAVFDRAIIEARVLFR